MSIFALILSSVEILPRLSTYVNLDKYVCPSDVNEMLVNAILFTSVPNGMYIRGIA